jgi:hypothetical protein
VKERGNKPAGERVVGEVREARAQHEDSYEFCFVQVWYPRGTQYTISSRGRRTNTPIPAAPMPSPSQW